MSADSALRAVLAAPGRALRRGRSRLDGTSARLVLSLGVVVGLGATGTYALWTDQVTVGGTSVSTDVLAPPTALTVTQTCVADPAPVRRSGTGGWSFSTGNAVGVLTIPRPSAAAPGDVLVAAITWHGNHATSQPAAPTGWTLVQADGNLTIGKYVYYRFVSAAEPASYTWTDIPEASTGGIAAYSGVDTVTPVAASGGLLGSASGQITAPSITTTRDNNVLLGFFAVADAATITPPASMSTLWSGTTAAAGGALKQISALAGEEPWPTAGATGTRTATHTSTGSPNSGQLVALQPPARPYANTAWTPSTSSFAAGQLFTRSSGGSVQRQATLPPSTAGQSDGPLVPGTLYNVDVTTTYANWTSTTTSSSFSARVC